MALMPGFEPAWATLVGGKCSHRCAIPCFPCCFLIVMKIATIMWKKKKKNIFTSSEFQGLSQLLIALTRNLLPWVSSHNISCKENEKYLLHQQCCIIINYLKKYLIHKNSKWGDSFIVWFQRISRLPPRRKLKIPEGWRGGGGWVKGPGNSRGEGGWTLLLTDLVDHF